MPHPCSFALVGVGLAIGCGHTPPRILAMPAPASIPEMKELEFYVGDWDCTGQTLDDQRRPVKRERLGVKVQPDLGGQYLRVMVFAEGKQATTELKGYDRRTKQFHHLWVDEDGAAGTLTSSGWEGNRMVFVEDAPEPGSRTRMTFTKLGDADYMHLAEVDKGGGYKPVFEKHCHKRS